MQWPMLVSLPDSDLSIEHMLTRSSKVEALYSEDTNPIINLLSLEAIKALVESLPSIVQSPNDIGARLKAQYGAWLCGIALGSVGMSLHHKLCHTLGGSFNMPHSETHTIILPHALAYNAPMIPTVMSQLAAIFPGCNGDAVRGLNLFLDSLKVRKDLKGLGFQEGDIDKAADIAVMNSYKNPRPIERSLIRETIRRAYAGEDAKADL
jgi:alcohol dehydrogenase class IV